MGRNSDILKIILAVILPPLGVFLERGCGADLLINILLTILGYIPGIIHALYVRLLPQFTPHSFAQSFMACGPNTTSQLMTYFFRYIILKY